MQVGNKVVCINDRFDPVIEAIYYQLPKLDENYTVRAVYLGRGKLKSGPEDGAEVGILLEELSNPADPRVINGTELGFNSERFRIVQEQPVAIKIPVAHGKED